MSATAARPFLLKRRDERTHLGCHVTTFKRLNPQLDRIETEIELSTPLDVETDAEAAERTNAGRWWPQGRRA